MVMWTSRRPCSALRSPGREGSTGETSSLQGRKPRPGDDPGEEPSLGFVFQCEQQVSTEGTQQIRRNE